MTEDCNGNYNSDFDYMIVPENGMRRLLHDLLTGNLVKVPDNDLDSSIGIQPTSPPSPAPVASKERYQYYIITRYTRFNWIKLIKVVRELTGLGLEEAKYAVDANNTPYDESVLYAYPPGARALWLSSDQVASLKEVDPGLILTCVP